MSDERFAIQGSPSVLEELRRELIDAFGDEAKVEPVAGAIPGQLREPALIAIIISFASTTGVAIRTAGRIIERRMLNQERMEELKIIREGDEREIEVADLIEGRLP